MWATLVKTLRVQTTSQTEWLERPIAGENWKIADSFINLALLLSQKEENCKDKEKNKNSENTQIEWHDLHVNQAEKVYENKQPLHYQELFKPLAEDEKGRQRNKVWLVGAAGSGKTTLAQRIAYDWSISQEQSLSISVPTLSPDIHTEPQISSNSTIPHSSSGSNACETGNPSNRFLGHTASAIELVIWIKLRELAADLEKNIEKDNKNDKLTCDITGEILPEKHFSLSFLRLLTKQRLKIQALGDIDSVTELLETHAKNILYLIDGYDEIASFPPTHAIHVIFMYLLDQPHVLVTSRPYYDIPAAIKNRDEFRRVELLGFGLTDMERYVDKHFNNDTAHPGFLLLKRAIRENLTLRGIGHIPVNLEILCTIIGSGLIQAEELDNISVTRLYSHMIGYLIRRALEPGRERQLSGAALKEFEGEELADDIAILKIATELGWLPALGSLALQGLIDKQVSIPSNTFTKHMLNHKTDTQTETDFLKDMMLLGFMQGLVRSQDNRRYIGHGEFLHLTLQEYFAAWFIAESWMQSPEMELPQITTPKTKVKLTARQLLQKYKYNPQFILVWPFVAGLLGQSGAHHVENFAKAFERLPLDVLSTRHYPLVLRCIEELPKVEQVPRNWQAFVANLQAILQQWQPDNYPPSIRPQPAVIVALGNSPRWNQCYLAPLLIAKLSERGLEKEAEKKRDSASACVLDILGVIGPAAATPAIFSALVLCLQDTDRGVNYKARGIFSQLGSLVAPEILPGLAACLRNDDSNERGHALDAVDVLGSAAATPEFLLVLITYLQRDSDKDIRVTALGAICCLKSAAATPEILSALVLCLRDSDKDIRGTALGAICSLGPAAAKPEILSALVLCLRDSDEDIRSGAVWAVGYLGPAVATPEILSLLVTCLRDSNSDVRKSTVEAVYQLGSVVARPEFLSVLATYFGDSDADIRDRARRVAGALGAAAATPEILSALVTCLQDANEYIRDSAMSAVGQLGAAAATPAVLSVLATYLRDNDNHLRCNAMEAINALGTAAVTPEILSALVTWLRDSDADIRRCSVWGVRGLGSAMATPAFLSELVLCLKDTNEGIRDRAMRIVGGLGSAAATPEILSALVPYLRDGSSNVRDCAVVVVGQLASRATTPRVLSKLVPYLRDDDAGIRRCVLEAIRQLGLAAVTPAGLPDLIPCSGDSDGGIHYFEVGNNVGRLDPDVTTPEFLSALVPCLKDANEGIRASALDAVGALRSAAAKPEILSALIMCLKDAHECIRNRVVWVIGQLGPTAAKPEILSALMTCLKDANERIRDRAIEAVRYLGSVAATPEFLQKLLEVFNVRDIEPASRDSILATFCVFDMENLAHYPPVLSSMLQHPAYLRRLFDKPETVVLGALQESCPSDYRLMPLNRRGEVISEIPLTQGELHSFLQIVTQARKERGMEVLSEEKIVEQDSDTARVSEDKSNSDKQKSAPAPQTNQTSDGTNTTVYCNTYVATLSSQLTALGGGQISYFNHPSPIQAIVSDTAHAISSSSNTNLISSTGGSTMTNKTLNDFNLFWKDATEVQRNKHLQHCAQLFAAEPAPTKAAVEEMVLLALYAQTRESYLALLSTYLVKLANLTPKSSYHFTGCAQLLMIGFQKYPKIEFEKGEIEQLLMVFVTLWDKVNLENQAPQEIDKGLSSLRQLLKLIYTSNVVLDVAQLAAIQGLTSGYKRCITKRPDAVEQKWLLDEIEQIINRLTRPRAKDAALESGGHLLTSLKHFVLMASNGMTGAATPFFIGTVGAVPDALKGLWHLMLTATPFVDYIKRTQFDIKDWYDTATALETRLLGLMQCTLLDNSAESEYAFANGINTLFENASFWSKQAIPVQQSIVDLLTAIVRSNYYVEAKGAAEERRVGLQKAALHGLVHIFRHSQGVKPRGLVLTYLLQLHAELPGLRETVQRCFNELLTPTPLVLDGISLLSEFSALNIEPSQLELAVLLAQVGCYISEEQSKPWSILYSALQSNHGFSALSETIKEQMKPCKEQLKLAIVQCFLHHAEKVPNYPGEQELAKVLGNKLTRYQSHGKIFTQYDEVMTWLQQLWESLVLRETETINLPLWSMTFEKPAEQKFLTYIKKQYNLNLIGKDAVMTNAKTTQDVDVAMHAAEKMRKLNKELPPSNDSVQIDEQTNVNNVQGGGLIHIFNEEDFFMGAAKALLQLKRELGITDKGTDEKKLPESPPSDDSVAPHTSSALVPVGANPATLFSSSHSGSSSSSSSSSSPLSGVAALGKPSPHR